MSDLFSENEAVRRESVLPSINLLYDADKPDRIVHFYPTSKSIALIRNLFGYSTNRAFFITGAYGSGKSLAATYILHAVENSLR
jgi:hypothetical protein